MFIVITQASDGSPRYLRNKSGQHMSVTNSLEHARRYATHRNAVDALTRKRLASDVDSMWHHGWVAPIDEQGLI